MLIGKEDLFFSFLFSFLFKWHNIAIISFRDKKQIKPLKSRKIVKEEEYNDYTAWRLSAAAGIAKSKARKEARAKRLDNKKPKKEKSKTINKGRDDTYFFYPH